MKARQLQSEQSRWNELDLIERLCRVLDIAALAVEHLAASGYSDASNPAKNIRPEKIISETAILLVAASPVAAGREVGERMKNIAHRLIPHARSKRMMLGLCLEPSVAWDYAVPHVCLSRLGYRDSAFDELLGKSLESQAHAGRERAPHRALEQEWVAMSWPESGSRRPRATRSTARRPILNHPMDLTNGTRDDIYAFTHALMYVADFHLHPLPLPRPRREILAEAEPVLARCLDEQDYDLSGEILLAWPLTGKSWSAAAAFAFRVLARVEDKATFLPTPGTRLNELKALEGIQRTQYLLATIYHTAYVMGLLSAVSLRPGYGPPVSIQSNRVAPGAAKRIMRVLDADGQSPHWLDEFEKLAEAEMDALATFLINIALRRRVARRDFGGLREVLSLAYDLNLADIPSASQSAEMLERLATLAKIAGNHLPAVAFAGHIANGQTCPRVVLLPNASGCSAARGKTRRNNSSANLCCSSKKGKWPELSNQMNSFCGA